MGTQVFVVIGFFHFKVASDLKMSCGKFFFLNNKEKRCGTFVKWHFISTHAEYLHNICICMHSNMEHLECPCKLSNFSLSMCSFLSHLFTLTPLLSEISLLRCFYLCKPDNTFISLLFLFLPPFFCNPLCIFPKPYYLQSFSVSTRTQLSHYITATLDLNWHRNVKKIWKSIMKVKE